jgi:drug/metabolite transporter (DMT)-like permease
VTFALLSAIWGVPYLFIRIAVRDGVPPLVLAWARVTLAAAILLALAWQAGTLPAVRGRGRAIAAYAVAEIVFPFSLIATGERHISSSLAAIVIAAVPLIMAVIAMRFDHAERPSPQRAFGLAVGFAGVIALVGIDVAGRESELLGTGAVFVAAVGYAVGPMIIKHRLSRLDARATMGASLAVASVLLAPLAALTWPSRTPAAGGMAAVVVLGVVCTAGAFAILPTLIAEVGPSRASVITYVNPVVAVALGVVLLGERPGAGAVAGLLLILTGSWMSTDGRLPPGLARLRSASRVTSGNLDQDDRVEHDGDRERNRPPVEVALN